MQKSLPDLNEFLKDFGEELPPEKTQTNRELVCFWAEYECECGHFFEGPEHHAPLMLKIEISKAIRHFGRHFGYKHHAFQYIPVLDCSLYDGLPRKVEIKNIKIHRCIKCAQRPQVIYLGDVA